MNKKIHNFFGNLFLSATALCWMSCDSTSSNSPIHIADEDPASSNGISASSSSSNISAESSSSEVSASSSSSEVSASSSSNEVSANSSSADPASSSLAASSSLTASSSSATSSSSHKIASSSSEEPIDSTGFINIVQALSTLTPPDTNKLMGKCVSTENYCATRRKSDRHEFNPIQYSLIADAEEYATGKIDSLLNDEQSASFSENKIECLKSLFRYTCVPDYGIYTPLDCDEYLKTKTLETPCDSLEEGVRIDASYIRSLEYVYQLERGTYIKVLKRFNENVASCDSLE